MKGENSYIIDLLKRTIKNWDMTELLELQKEIQKEIEKRGGDKDGKTGDN